MHSHDTPVQHTHHTLASCAVDIDVWLCDVIWSQNPAFVLHTQTCGNPTCPFQPIQHCSIAKGHAALAKEPEEPVASQPDPAPLVSL
jgi:hypothetical protein